MIIHVFIKFFITLTLEVLHMVNNYQEMRAANAAARGCDAAWRGEGNINEASTGSTVASPEGKDFALFFRHVNSSGFDYNIYDVAVGRSHSPAAFENNNSSKIQAGAQSCTPNSATVNASPHEEFPGFASPNDVNQSGPLFYSFNKSSCYQICIS